MKIKDAKQEIVHTILAYTAKNEWGGYAIPAIRQRPLLLIGPPGVGKTAVMAQAAAQCGVGFVSYTMTHHTRQSAIGLPYIEHREFGGQQYSVTEYTMSEIIASVYRAIEETGCQEGLLFLDEINCVSETLAPAILQFLQTKTFGSHRLPEGWVLAAAGNPQEYNKSVREFDIATLDRLKYITVDPDYDAWRGYALASGIHAAILSYLDTHPEKFYVLEQACSRQVFVTARGWEDLSCMLLQYEALSLPVSPDLVMQYLHTEELARDFAGYYHWFAARQKSIPVMAMMKGGKEEAALCRSLLATAPFSEQLHLVHLMLSCIGTGLIKYNQEAEQFKRFSDTLEQLLRYQKQQKFFCSFDALTPFLEKEGQVLRVRQEHGLSSEEEIRQLQQTLYEFRALAYQYNAQKAVSIQSDDLEIFLRREQQLRQTSLVQSARQVLDMLENGTALFSVPELSDGDAAFPLFLSSLRQNPRMNDFLKNHPCPAFDECCKRLDFQSREAALRARL